MSWRAGRVWRYALRRLREINARGGHAVRCDTQSAHPTTRRKARIAARKVFLGEAGCCACCMLMWYGDRWWERRQRRATVDGEPFPWVGKGRRWTSVSDRAEVA